MSGSIRFGCIPVRYIINNSLRRNICEFRCWLIIFITHTHTHSVILVAVVYMYLKERPLSSNRSFTNRPKLTNRKSHVWCIWLWNIIAFFGKWQICDCDIRHIYHWLIYYTSSCVHVYCNFMILFHFSNDK